MPIQPILTEDDYRSAMRELAAFFDHEPEPNSPEAQRFEFLLTLAEGYEAKHFPVALPDVLGFAVGPSTK